MTVIVRIAMGRDGYRCQHNRRTLYLSLLIQARQFAKTFAALGRQGSSIATIASCLNPIISLQVRWHSEVKRCDARWQDLETEVG